MSYKVLNTHEDAEAHSDAEVGDLSPSLPPLHLRCRDVPASSWLPILPVPAYRPPTGARSSPQVPSPTPGVVPVLDRGGPASIPLDASSTSLSMTTLNIPTAMRMVITCIDICVVMLTTYTTSAEASKAHMVHRRQLRRRGGGEVSTTTNDEQRRRDQEEDALEHPHVKQIVDLIAWHIGAIDAKWYVKPRSTCCFEEYIFNIYTPEMFYDILRMRRRTFDRLVSDLKPFIHGQRTN